MKASLLKGKRIKKVHQYNWKDSDTPGWIIDAIEFDDGTFLRFVVKEGEGDYGVAGVYPARGVEEHDLS